MPIRRRPLDGIYQMPLFFCSVVLIFVLSALAPFVLNSANQPASPPARAPPLPAACLHASDLAVQMRFQSPPRTAPELPKRRAKESTYVVGHATYNQ